MVEATGFSIMKSRSSSVPSPPYKMLKKKNLKEDVFYSL
jgi:hypothetical protein